MQHCEAYCKKNYLTVRVLQTGVLDMEVEKICEHCGSNFKTWHHIQKYCGTTCRELGKGQKYLEKWAQSSIKKKNPKDLKALMFRDTKEDPLYLKKFRICRG